MVEGADFKTAIAISDGNTSKPSVKNAAQYNQAYAAQNSNPQVQEKRIKEPDSNINKTDNTNSGLANAEGNDILVKNPVLAQSLFLISNETQKNFNSALSNGTLGASSVRGFIPPQITQNVGLLSFKDKGSDKKTTLDSVEDDKFPLKNDNPDALLDAIC
ncbi:MAG: hypothetical protein PHE78_02170 [Candidatus Gastranaerophilales bacterium]|nr:hypothetical protein [Candidatus Gastranaerophilales bacterium]